MDIQGVDENMRYANVNLHHLKIYLSLVSTKENNFKLMEKLNIKFYLFCKIFLVLDAPTEADVKFLPEQSIVTTFMGDSVEQTCQAACRPNCTLIWQKVMSKSVIKGNLSLPNID